MTVGLEQMELAEPGVFEEPLVQVQVGVGQELPVKQEQGDLPER